MPSFKDFDLSSPLLQAISEMGFETPSPIQAETLPLLLGEPTDFLGLAATGTGKTAAFSIPLLERLDPTVRSVQGLILCPTRELAMQVAGQINLLGKFKGLHALPIYGGSDYANQIRGLRAGTSIVVGTPGRVVDHMKRGTLKLDDLQVLILDEADEMISMGFKDDLETILSNVPMESSNIWLFSATMSPEVRKVADEYLRNPQQVQVNRKEVLSGTVEQLYYITSESNKPEVLCKLVESAPDFYGLIFCQTKSLVSDLTRYLTERRYSADCLHGDMDQNAREKTMQAFRDRKVNLLVCTDVASRGLDVKDVTHVINYSLPRELDSYVHRIGRTARSGKTGFALNLVTASHRGLIHRIEKATKSKMKEGKIPTRKDIGMKKIAQSLPRFQAQKAFSRAVDLLDQAWKDALAEMSREEIAGRMLSLLYPEVFNAEREDQFNEDRKKGLPSSLTRTFSDKREKRNKSENSMTYKSGHEGRARSRFNPSGTRDRGFSRHDQPRAEDRGFSRHDEETGFKKKKRDRERPWKPDKNKSFKKSKSPFHSFKKDSKRTSNWNRPLTGR